MLIYHHKNLKFAPLFVEARRIERLLMTSRTTTSTVTLAYPFVISGYPNELPAGSYEFIVEEDLLTNRSFISYQRTATYLLINRKSGVRHKQMCLVDSEDWDLTMSNDRKRSVQENKN
jgi:hypothetical protein